MEEIKQQSERTLSAITDIAHIDHGTFTDIAQKIANVSLQYFSGELLNRALAISRALVEFEDEAEMRIKQDTEARIVGQD